MIRAILFLCIIQLIHSSLVAQEYKPVTVKAGTSLKEYFTDSQRYLYPNFTQGSVIFKNRIITPSNFNFNLLTGEIEFIHSKDTLFFPSKNEIDLIVVARDTFYYHNAYLQLIRSGPLNLYLKRSMIVMNILKQGAFGTVNRSAASESYDFVITKSLSIDLKPVDDMVLQRKDEYFYSTTGSDFNPFTRKNITRIMPGKEKDIRNFLKTFRVDFESREDLLRLTDFMNNLQSEHSGKR